MADICAGWAVLSAALLGILLAWCLRASGSRQFGNWLGGGEITFVGILALFSFLGCCGAMILQGSAVWGVAALLAWFVGYRSYSNANRRRRQAEDELRRINAAKHPGVFDAPAPATLTSIRGDSVDLYDAGTCAFLGVVNKSDISVLIGSLTLTTDDGPNDIFVMEESLDLIPATALSEGFAALLKNALAQRDYLVLRWMPRTEERRAD